MPDIMHHLKISALPQEVYAALTTADGIRNWWTRDAEFESRIDGTGELRFSQCNNVIKLRVDELEPPTRVGWKATSSLNPQWDGTTIAFDLRKEGEATVLSFAHRGFEKADDVYARTTTGWGYFLVSLRQYLETGNGGPSPDIDFARFMR
ncbi:SRPBCC family protein [Methyloferula stellata]|uniref:SRPBCC family protein n=1 Tax=Methyloferula stellata TaxID=876270 RepID=UPI000367F357|nr:SRPBCC domain-containing protein [Methyloferula stellata]